MSKLPKEIIEDIGLILDKLRMQGFTVLRSQYCAEDFGNYFVDFKGPSYMIYFEFRIVRDHGQYAISSDKAYLEEHGLWKYFDNKDEFADKLMVWISKIVIERCP